MAPKIVNIEPKTRAGQWSLANLFSNVSSSITGRSGSSVRIARRTGSISVPGATAVRMTTDTSACGSCEYGT